MTYLTKGTVLNSPDGGGYILTRDVEVGEVLRPSQFEAFGGADPIKGGEMVPKWLWPEMKRMRNDSR